MKRICLIVSFVLLKTCIGIPVVGAPPQDPIDQLLVSPDIIFNHRDQLGMSTEQMAQIREAVENTAPLGQQLRERNENAIKRLVQLLKDDTIADDAVLKQFDKVMEVESQQKRLHMQMMLRVRNVLSPKQITIATQLKRSTRNQEAEQRLHAKLQRIQLEVEARSSRGEPPYRAVERMQRFPQLMKAGKINAAEALLDRVTRLLDIEKPDEHAVGKKRTPQRLPGTTLQQLDPVDLRAEVIAMKKDNVAWRGIKWKTCLLDGLKASRDQKKPIILWVFIDRPIDDERC